MAHYTRCLVPWFVKMDTDYPVFKKLLNIFVINYNEVYFEVQVLNTLEFNCHYHCFVVQMSSLKSTVKYNNLFFSFQPHHIRTMPVLIQSYTVLFLNVILHLNFNELIMNNLNK